MGKRIFHAKAIYMAENNFDIVFVHHEKYFEQAMADCALLGAAPDLLAALEEMAAQHYCGCNHPACWSCKRDEMCKQAIARAKGDKT